MKKLTTQEISYIAGFLDGDGSIYGRIVRDETYKYNFSLRVTVSFHQSTKRRWFLEKLKKKLKCGIIEDKKAKNKDSKKSELVINSFERIETLLLLLKPYLLIKRKQANLVLEFFAKKKNLTNKADFIKLCQIIDKISNLNDSKRRVLTAQIVEKELMENESIL